MLCVWESGKRVRRSGGQGQGWSAWGSGGQPKGDAQRQVAREVKQNTCTWQCRYRYGMHLWPPALCLLFTWARHCFCIVECRSGPTSCTWEPTQPQRCWSLPAERLASAQLRQQAVSRRGCGAERLPPRRPACPWHPWCPARRAPSCSPWIQEAPQPTSGCDAPMLPCQPILLILHL